MGGWAPLVGQHCLDARLAQQVATHLGGQRAVLHAAGHRKNALEAVWIFNELGQPHQHLQGLEPFLEVQQHLDLPLA